MSDKKKDDLTEQDSPIFIFPDDADEESSGSSSSLSRLNFGKVSAEKKEKEFVYMPFLEDKGVADDDEEESSSLSFSKVKAAKKESEFIFMPFLNDTGADDSSGDDHHLHIRPDGTIFDEGLILMPISPLTDDDEDDSSGDEAYTDEDTGIYVTDTAPGAYVPPKRPQSKKGSKNGKKKRPASGYGSSKSGRSKNQGGTQYADEQFRAAMKNINPDIRRAAMHDPVQRAALEQAVRIALMQQAAQEAVARTTGGFGGMLYQAPMPSAASGNRKPPRRPAQTPTSVKGFQFAAFDSSPSDFTVGEPTPAPAAPVVSAPIPAAPVSSPEESIDFASTLNPQPASVPDVGQDPALASLSPSGTVNRAAPSAQQDPALSSLTRGSSQKQSVSFTSPAAIRAAMRAGADLSTLQSSPAAVTASSAASSQKQRLQEAVDTKKSGCLIGIIIIFFAFFVGLLTIAVWPALSNEKKYLDASSLMAEGNYIAASEAYNALGDYKDSVSRYNENVYLYATGLENSGEYEKAIEYFSGIENYSASTERIAECRYNLGTRAMQEGRYADAYDQLHLIPRYSDAGDLAIQANYQCALQLYEDGQLDEAAVRFKLFDSYLDSHTYWQICLYNSGRNYVQKGVYASAYENFKQLGDYSDSLYFRALSLYHMLEDGYQNATIVEIRDCVNLLASYGVKLDFSSVSFAPIKMQGMWQNDDTGYFISFQIVNNSAIFKTNMTDDGSTLTISNVFFEGPQICYRSSDSEKQPLLQINYFDPENSSEPELVNIYSFYNYGDMTFNRSY